MATNGINTDDADMAECDGEKVVTMMDVLQEQQEFEDDANAVLGASDDKNCTYSKGYIKRQAIYACLTCCSDAKNDPSKRAGVCLACSLNCHENHELIELYTKRNFRCDCGNPKFNGHPCQFVSNKSDLNEENSYNQNFSGIYCTCHRPYPDPDATFEDEMIQCIVCEDWLHASHLETVVPNEQYSEMICKACMDKNEFLHDYSDITVTAEPAVVDIMSVANESSESHAIEKVNGVLEKSAVENGNKDEELESNNPLCKVELRVESSAEKCSLETSDSKTENNPTETKVENGIETSVASTDNKELVEDTTKDNDSLDESDSKSDNKIQTMDGIKENSANMEIPVNKPESEELNNENSIIDSIEKLESELGIIETIKPKDDELNVTTNTASNEEQKSPDDTVPKSPPNKSDDEFKIQESNEIEQAINKSTDINNKSDICETEENNESNTNQNGSKEEPSKIEESKDVQEENTKDVKRKLSEDKENIICKKAKLDDIAMCKRPKGITRKLQGATFWPYNFRQKLCTCNECISMYKDLSVLFLIDPEDTVTAYEALGKEKIDGTAVSQYEKGLEALSSLDRIQQINALTEYNKMRDKLLDFLKSFKDRKEIVKEEDIKAFFAGMKPKREPDGVYFCR